MHKPAKSRKAKSSIITFISELERAQTSRAAGAHWFVVVTEHTKQTKGSRKTALALQTSSKYAKERKKYEKP